MAQTENFLKQLRSVNYNTAYPVYSGCRGIDAAEHDPAGAIIISASGMCDASRIKHHLKYNFNRPECSIIITGFQAARTLGRRLVDGARVVKIFGRDIVVRAEIYTIGGLSAHADQKALLDWLGHFKNTSPNIRGAW
ncbi:MBL fold metallo-hydrolase RNA specificity domain-containing protein [Nitrosomonas sp. Nm51]|uniref:MBL fold metallo-hydrolase RNA specificity domain-containing protein n=1 Tax=Nitrosomonas sp. Nm51 TaxID=133720 RepID=UPI0035272B2C